MRDSNLRKMSKENKDEFKVHPCVTEEWLSKAYSLFTEIRNFASRNISERENLREYLRELNKHYPNGLSDSSRFLSKQQLRDLKFDNPVQVSESFRLMFGEDVMYVDSRVNHLFILESKLFWNCLYEVANDQQVKYLCSGYNNMYRDITIVFARYNTMHLYYGLIRQENCFIANNILNHSLTSLKQQIINIENEKKEIIIKFRPYY